MKRKELLNNILDFLNSDMDILCDHVSNDLGIDIDYECSNIYDEVKERFLDKSFEEIIEKTKDRICIAIESFIENPE
jgi:hypothetical protein